MITVVVVLVALVAAAISCVLTRRAAAAWLLIALCAVWMPVNNGVLEGKVLLVLDHTHGLTASDLFSVVGFVIAGVTLWLPAAPVSRRRRLAQLGGAGGLIVAGLVTAYYVQA